MKKGILIFLVFISLTTFSSCSKNENTLMDYPSLYPKFEVICGEKQINWVRGDGNFTGSPTVAIGNTNFGADKNIASKLKATKIKPGSIISVKADEVQGLDKPTYKVIIFDKVKKYNSDLYSDTNEFAAPSEEGIYLFYVTIDWGIGDNEISYWFKAEVSK